MSKTTEFSAQAVVSGLKNLSASAKALHARKDALEAQIAAHRDAPISLEDFAQFLRKWVSARAVRYGTAIKARTLISNEQQFGMQVDPLNLKPWSALEQYANADVKIFDIFSRGSVIFSDRDGAAIDAFCYFLPEIVEAKLMAEIKAACGARWGNEGALPIADRLEAINDLRQKLADLQPEIRRVEAEIASVSSALSGSDD